MHFLRRSCGIHAIGHFPSCSSFWEVFLRGMGGPDDSGPIDLESSGIPFRTRWMNPDPLDRRTSNPTLTNRLVHRAPLVQFSCSLTVNRWTSGPVRVGPPLGYPDCWSRWPVHRRSTGSTARKHEAGSR